MIIRLLVCNSGIPPVGFCAFGASIWKKQPSGRQQISVLRKLGWLFAAKILSLGSFCPKNFACNTVHNSLHRMYLHCISIAYSMFCVCLFSHWTYFTVFQLGFKRVVRLVGAQLCQCRPIQVQNACQVCQRSTSFKYYCFDCDKKFLQQHKPKVLFFWIVQ